MAVRVNIDGLSASVSDVNKIIGKFNSEVTKAFNAFGENVAADAKKNAPADEGRLRNSISYQKIPFGVEIVAATNYAAYLEFGTRKFAAQYVASLPADWQEYAAKFKGKTGGSMDEFIQNIMAWVRRKGIGGDLTKSGRTSTSKSSLDKMQEAAYWIALNILQNGIRERPFLYPAVNANSKKLNDDLNNVLNS